MSDYSIEFDPSYKHSRWLREVLEIGEAFDPVRATEFFVTAAFENPHCAFTNAEIDGSENPILLVCKLALQRKNRALESND